MTEKELRDHVIDIALSYYGIQEGSIQHKQIVNDYNAVKPLPRGHKLRYDDSWCDAFVTVVGDKAGISDLIGRECGCEEHVKIFKALGIWVEDGTIIPEKADIIVYNWDDNTQPNDGYSDHIGYVAAANTATGVIKAVEGNRLNAVGYRNIAIGAGQIRGYAKPDYASMTQPEHFYGSLGWHWDEVGWWYNWGYNKGEYYNNEPVKIYSEKRKKEELYFFDVSGYAVNPNRCELDENGSIVSIYGDLIK